MCLNIYVIARNLHHDLSLPKLINGTNPTQNKQLRALDFLCERLVSSLS